MAPTLEFTNGCNLLFTHTYWIFTISRCLHIAYNAGITLKMIKNFIGKLFGDKGYLSKKLAELLGINDVELITKLKRNMKPKIIALFDKILLRKRSIIETINDQLKNISQIEHSRHRSLTNCMINVVAGLLAYSYQDKRPSLNIRVDDILPLLCCE